MRAIEYRRARSVAEAMELKATLAESRYIAGGTDLVVSMKNGRARPRALVSLRGVAELCGVNDGDATRIGALTLLGDLEASAILSARHPALAQAIATMGSVQIRNAATIGGNLANASPCADTAPPLLVLEGELAVAGESGTRRIPAERFFTGPGATLLGPDELLLGIHITPRPAVRSTFLKRTRTSMDLGIASVAMALRCDGGTLRGVRVAAGAVAPVPMRLRTVEELLEGQPPSAELAGAAAERACAEVRPITDVRASADYRRHIVGVYVRRALAVLTAERP